MNFLTHEENRDATLGTDRNISVGLCTIVAGIFEMDFSGNLPCMS